MKERTDSNAKVQPREIRAANVFTILAQYRLQLEKSVRPTSIIINISHRIPFLDQHVVMSWFVFHLMSFPTGSPGARLAQLLCRSSATVVVWLTVWWHSAFPLTTGSTCEYNIYHSRAYGHWTLDTGHQRDILKPGILLMCKGWECIWTMSSPYSPIKDITLC